MIQIYLAWAPSFFASPIIIMAVKASMRCTKRIPPNTGQKRKLRAKASNPLPTTLGMGITRRVVRIKGGGNMPQTTNFHPFIVVNGEGSGKPSRITSFSMDSRVDPPLSDYRTRQDTSRDINFLVLTNFPIEEEEEEKPMWWIEERRCEPPHRTSLDSRAMRIKCTP